MLPPFSRKGMGRPKGKRWTVKLRGRPVFHCTAESEKEAIDAFEASLDDLTLDEWCAEQGCTFEDVRGSEG